MKRLVVCWVSCLAILFSGPSIPAAASQVYGHLYFADLMLEALAGQHLSAQDQTLASFYLGSIAPDSAWIAHMFSNNSVRSRLTQKYGVKFPRELQPLSTPLDDVHQNRPTDVSLQLLQGADLPEERAFATGWLSHYIVDSYIHDLINQFGGFVTDPTQFESPGMKVHDRLEALEMRHVFEARGPVLRNAAERLGGTELPRAFLYAAFQKTYRQNEFYSNHSAYFARVLRESSELMRKSMLWYGFQSEHTPAEIARMKGLIRRFRPQAGKVLDIIPDLPSRQEYRQQLAKGDFIAAWTIRADTVARTSRYLIGNCTAYYWWRDRHTDIGDEMAAAALDRITGELYRINPRDDLMQPR